MRMFLLLSFVLALLATPVLAEESTTEKAIQLKAAGDIVDDKGASTTEKAVKMEVLNDEDDSLTKKALKLKGIDAMGDAAK